MKKEKKKLNKRALIGGGAILGALLLTFVISPIYNRASEAKCTVIRITKDVSEGKQITASDIEVVTVGSFGLASEVYRESEDVLNQYATADLKKGDYIVEGKISENPISANTYLWELEGDKEAVSITIPSFAAGLSGKLEAGDIISIAAVKKENDISTSMIPTELNYVEVLAVTADTGIDVDAQVAGRKEGSEEELPVTITLLVNDKQFLKLAELESTGSTHIALVHRGNNKQEYLDLQEELIANMLEESIEEAALNEMEGEE